MPKKKSSKLKNQILEQEKQERMASKKNYHTVNTMDKRNSIRIGLVGCVSCGKSTLLNAICVNQYEEMKKCRTTMLPSIYSETNQSTYNNKEERQKIFDKNKENNHKIYTGEVKLTNENCNVVENMIPKIKNFTELPQNVYLDIIDIPGLNDACTRSIYYKWIEDNFSELDVIIHIIDINSPLNTSDQIDILEMLIKNIKNEKINNNRDVFLLTLVNKCDDMEQDKNGDFQMDEEDQENYDNIVKKTYEKIQEICCNDKTMASYHGNPKTLINCEFSPISAADTFVYRMLHNDPNVEMDMKLLQKFGVNEVGRRTWNKMDDEERREMISDHFSKVDISDTLEITGYNNFTSILKRYLTKPKQSTILINRIRQELKNEEIINKNISTDKNELKKLIDIYNSYCSKVWIIDKLYKTKNASIVTDLINQHISRWINQISDLSNESDLSIQRLQDYKDIINELNNTIDTYALVTPIQMELDDNKKKRWTDSLGIKTGAVFDVCEMTMKTLFNRLVGGYSNLQNEFYLNNLKENKTYEDFPNKVYSNIDSLRDNSYDAIEPTIDTVIQKINTMISNHGWLPADNSVSNIQGSYTAPMCGYYEIDNKNTIILFCEKLINLYDYPKEKVIQFLMNYVMNRYVLLQANQSRFLSAFKPTVKNDRFRAYFKAYTIILDSCLFGGDSKFGRAVDGLNEYDVYLRNLYLVNKSYLYTSQSLNPGENYFSNYKEVLAIPIYLDRLVNKSNDGDNKKDVEVVSSDSDDEFFNVDTQPID